MSSDVLNSLWLDDKESDIGTMWYVTDSILKYPLNQTDKHYNTMLRDTHELVNHITKNYNTDEHKILYTVLIFVILIHIRQAYFCYHYEIGQWGIIA